MIFATSSNLTTSSVKLFLKDLKESGSVQSNPLAWLIAILVVAPAIFIGIEELKMAKSFQIILG